jgi:hypothetical protein
MPDVTGGKGSFGGSGTAGRNASNTGTGRSQAERARQAAFEKTNNFSTSQSATGPVFTSTSGLSSGISVSPSRDLQKANQERASIYNSAAGKWNKSAQTRSFSNFVNALRPMGFAMEPPDISRPSTFSGGDYHLGLNPGNLLGGLLGGALVPGGGIPASVAGGAIYDATGLGNVMIGGSGNMGMPTWGGSAHMPASNMPGGGMGPSAGGQPGGSLLNGGFSNTGNGGGLQQLQNLAQINANVSGNPAAPESVGPATPTGPNYNQIMASIRQVTPGYSVSLPGYQYGKATV